MRQGRWDVVVCWNAAAGMWWWNAWCESTATEMAGLAPSIERARDDMAQRMADADQALLRARPVS